MKKRTKDIDEQSIPEAFNEVFEDPSTPDFNNYEIPTTRTRTVNMTAVICTAIVAFTAAIILLICLPMRHRPTALVHDTVWRVDTVFVAQNAINQDSSAVRPISPEQRQAMNSDPEIVSVRDEEQMLPQVNCNPIAKPSRFNGIRLVDTRKRALTESEINQLSADELYLARNANYAIHGYRFNNSELRDFFDPQPWFKAVNTTPADIEAKWTTIEKDNINLIRERERQLSQKKK